MTFDPEEYGPEAVHWPEMTQTLVDFGLSRQTAARLVGQPHVTQEMVERWVVYCRLRGRGSKHGSTAFLITRLLRNDIPPPSWGALRRLEKRVGARQLGNNSSSQTNSNPTASPVQPVAGEEAPNLHNSSFIIPNSKGGQDGGV